MLRSLSHLTTYEVLLLTTAAKEFKSLLKNGAEQDQGKAE